IFPADCSTKVLLPFSSKKISSLHRNGVINKLPEVFNKRQVCLVRNDLCSKTKKNRRNELNRFKKNGGEIVPVTQYNPVQICNIYDTLFKKRWGVNVDRNTLHSLEKFITDNPSMIFGNVLQMNSQPCAYDLIIKSESPRWLYFDIPNGGMDPSYTHLSVGSVLMWVNTQQAISLGISKGKETRFSLGKPTMNYKKRWCDPHYLLRTI
ncbi:TPA: GNAT family N-acetyltransferase, partial [Klebsiella pneumoniae]|nr:GNAT family N-acetyltransferase [Klebsiella pneumoniae]